MGLIEKKVTPETVLAVIKQAPGTTATKLSDGPVEGVTVQADPANAGTVEIGENGIVLSAGAIRDVLEIRDLKRVLLKGSDASQTARVLASINQAKLKRLSHVLFDASKTTPTFNSGTSTTLTTERGSDLTVTRGSAAWYFDENNVLREVDTHAVALYGSGYVWEPQRTNLLPYSDDFSQWTQAGSPTITAGQSDPDGGTSACLLGDDNAAATEFLYRSATLAANTYHVYSVRVKAGTAANLYLAVYDATTSTALIRGNFPWTSGALGGFTLVSGSGFGYSESLGNGWYRAALVFKTGANTSCTAYFYPAGNSLSSDTGTVYAYRAQVEQGTYPTTPIRTTGSQVTRNAGYTYDASRKQAAARLISFPAATNKCQYGNLFSQNLSAYLTGSGLYLPGTSGNYASSDSAAVKALTGDIDIRRKMSLVSWASGSSQSVASNYSGGTGWYFYITASGSLMFGIGDGSSSQWVVSSVSTGFGAGAPKWLRVTRRVSDGRLQFFTSDDGSTWTQLGTDLTLLAGTSITAATQDLALGTTPANIGVRFYCKGTDYRAVIYSDLTETTKVFDADFSAQSATVPGEAQNNTDTFTESSSNAATVTINKSIQGWSLSGDAAAKLTIVDDPAELKAAGLHHAVYDGKVLKLDNSTGASEASANASGATGNTNTHAVSGYGRATAGSPSFRFHGGSGGSVTISAATYNRYSFAGTPFDSNRNWQATCPAGAVVYFILPQLEEGSVATDPMPSSTGSSVSRSKQDWTTPYTETFDLTKGITAQVELMTHGDTGAYQYPFRLGYGSNPRMTLYVSPGGALSISYIDNSGTETIIPVATSGEHIGQRIRVTMCHDPSTDTLRAYLGSALDSSTDVVMPNNGSTWGGNTISQAGPNVSVYSFAVVPGVFHPNVLKTLFQ